MTPRDGCHVGYQYAPDLETVGFDKERGQVFLGDIDRCDVGHQCAPAPETVGFDKEPR